jgi:hypothetical protein
MEGISSAGVGEALNGADGDLAFIATSRRTHTPNFLRRVYCMKQHNIGNLSTADTTELICVEWGIYC